ncbi:MAG: hypothetical protein HW383_28 [Candidatus Magasanikbacteria bacterium]|nr:hypothetical protein [Candidatus Magasanikbacteria bacterium]
MTFFRQSWYPKGAAAIISIILVGAAVLTITVSANLIGIQETQNAFVGEKYEEAAAAADGCVEWALQKLKNSSQYGGNETLTIGNGACQIGAVTKNGQQRTFSVSSTVNTFSVRENIDLSKVNPDIRFNSWQRVSP